MSGKSERVSKYQKHLYVLFRKIVHCIVQHVANAIILRATQAGYLMSLRVAIKE